MTFFIQGFIWGLVYVAPIGLQNLFVINTALTQKRSRVYTTALIIIFFDVTLALACFYGIGAIMQKSQWVQIAVLFIGSIIVMWIGFGLLKAKDKLDTSTKVDVPILKVISTACVVTWFNPQALIDGSMMLGAIKATLPADSNAPFIIGVAIASCTWFLSVSTILTLFGSIMTDKVLRWINIICGGVIIIYGIKLFVNFVQMVWPMIG
ncbi:L-lysine exporter family protein LysE/ArgO [Clostridiales Family XIII bacterium PM5-7]